MLPSTSGSNDLESLDTSTRRFDAATSASAAMLSSYQLPREPAGSCTESLGSESGDVGADAEIDQLSVAAAGTAVEVRCTEGLAAAAGLLAEAQTPSPEKRRFPPAMPRRTAEAFMRAERRDGRLILTELVRVERPRKVFRVSRADGRLTLRFADDSDGEEAEMERQEEDGACVDLGVVTRIWE